MTDCAPRRARERDEPDDAVSVAQLVERRTVAPDVAGSSPVTHPTQPGSRPRAPLAVGEPGRRLRHGFTLAVRLAIVAAWLSGCGSAAPPLESTGHAPGGAGPQESAGRAPDGSGPLEPGVRTPGGTGGTNDPSVAGQPYFVLVSFDGVRPDYLDRFDTPGFDRLAARGVRAAGLVSVFPSLTFPGHYSIATGLHPEAHGIVGNRFYDPERGEEFDYREREAAQDGSWWGGEPIWVTAETQGMVAAAFFFPGTEADIGGVRPSHWRPYDGSVPNVDRIEQVLAWLALPAAERPHLVTLYFSLVDTAGHRLGPEQGDMRESVEAADRLLGRLMDGLDALPHARRTGLVVVSDHGMATVDPERLTVLPQVAGLGNARLVADGPSISVHVGDAGRGAALRDELNARMTHARAYLREELPPHLHARGNARIGDIMVLPEGTGMVLLRGGYAPPAGMHGWDPTLPAMHGIFFAAGPGIEVGVTLPPVEAVGVYPLVAHLLGLTPSPAAESDLAPFAPGLRSPP